MKLDINSKVLKPKGKFDIKKEIFSWVEVIVFTIIFMSIFMVVVFRMSPVDGSSMEPTLQDCDRIISTNIHGKYDYNDVVVIRRKDDTTLVKRIIALEGDKIDIDFDTGSVYVNDKLLSEPFINEITKKRKDFVGPTIVPDGHVFVMGDNRNHSDDSRLAKIGMIDKRNVLGKVIFRIFPLDKIGKIE